MDAGLQSVLEEGHSAQLRIHVQQGVAGSRPFYVGALLWLREFRGPPGAVSPEAVTHLDIDDRWGCRIFSSDDGGPLIKVNLPPGTYDITARRGGFRRCYTLTLEPGGRSDLHMQLTGEKT